MRTKKSYRYRIFYPNGERSEIDVPIAWSPIEVSVKYQHCMVVLMEPSIEQPKLKAAIVDGSDLTWISQAPETGAEATELLKRICGEVLFARKYPR